MVVPANLEVTALHLHPALGPRGLDRDQTLVEELVALVEVDTEGAELGFQVARTHTERESPARQHVERHRRLRHEKRVPVRHDAEVGEETYGGGRASANNDATNGSSAW